MRNTVEDTNRNKGDKIEEEKCQNEKKIENY